MACSLSRLFASRVHGIIPARIIQPHQLMHIAAKLEQVLVQKDVQVMTMGEAILDSQVFRERADASRMLFVFHTKTTVLAPPVPVLGPRVPPCLHPQERERDFYIGFSPVQAAHLGSASVQ